MRCEHCPVRAALPCPDSPWHCRAVALDPARGEQLRRVADDAQVAALTVAEQVRLARARHACPHASPPACGCSDLVRCSQGRGVDGVADRQECYRCLLGGG